MQPPEIGRIVSAGFPRVSPDGRQVAFVVSRADAEANRYRSQIWLAPADGSRPAEPFTAGEHLDANPTWSPDGRRLAFTSERGSHEKKREVTLRVAPVGGGGETVTLAAFPEPVRDLSWAPDGRHLAFATRVRDARYEIDDPRQQPPRRITRFFSRLDNVGWTHDRPTHVFVIPTDGSGGPLDMTPGEFDFSAPAWAPDSRTLAFSGAAHDTWDMDLAVDIFTAVVGDGDPVPLTKQTGYYGFPAWSALGGAIAILGADEARRSPQNGRLGIVDMASGQHRWIGSALDRNFAPYGDARAPIWDDGGLLVSVEDRGSVHVFRVATDASGDPELVLGGDRWISNFDYAGGTLAFAASTVDRPAEIFVSKDGEERRLSFVTDGFVAQIGARPAARFTATSTDGVEVDAWVLTPPGYHPSQRYPALLNVHGGPFTQYGNRFFDEAQVQASAGYVVLLSNPRGSSGREESWGRAITGPKNPYGTGSGWGSVDYDDLMAVVDEALSRFPFIDPERLGVLGGSYGGYMTSWIVSHTNRFKAACSERAVNNMASEDWTSDIATRFRFELGATWFEDPDEYLRISPMTYVRDIETPLLIIHSEDDLRCPIEQAEQLFVALRLLGREVEFYRFPAEGHELSRSGSPVHRVQRADLILDFFGKHLQP
jgi:dipeptidyl aminopeptidase/acylaminoacyl peptidase